KGTRYVSSKAATWKAIRDTSRNNHRRGTMFILRILVEARSIKRPSCR
ncbi:hypothetical protein ALC53_10376, partial [Atta colombica]